MIELKNITKKFVTPYAETQLYSGLNFKIESWDFIAILGSSWSWKTTLLNMMSGLVNFDDWELSVNDKKYSEMTWDTLTKFRWANMSFIFQQFHLIPNLSVRENIELPLDINKTKQRFSVEEILKKVWLQDKIDSYPFNLSGWEQQRVAIARAFISDTPILLADEPTGNLDETNSKNVMEILTDLHGETQNTIVLITHDLDVAKYANKQYELTWNSLKLLK